MSSARQGCLTLDVATLEKMYSRPILHYTGIKSRLKLFLLQWSWQPFPLCILQLIFLPSTGFSRI